MSPQNDNVYINDEFAHDAQAAEDAYMAEMYAEECITQESKELYKNIEALKVVTAKIASLINEKEMLNKKVMDYFGGEPGHSGQKTVPFMCWNVKVERSKTLKVNKDNYESGFYQVAPTIDPVKAKTEYTVDKKLYQQVMANAPADVRKSLEAFISETLSKPRVTITERTR